jgi:glycosyltransferase involved in cell wall biosynthesis
MQAGIPIVATNVGEFPEVLHRGRYGRLVQPGNPEELASALEEVYRNHHEAKQKALTAKQRALTEYSLEKIAQRYFEEYQNVLSTNRK